MADVYPSQFEEVTTFGVLPVDFLLETVLSAGIQWFKTDPNAYKQVYGHLFTGYLAGRYGQAKAQEIRNFIVKYDIKVVQSFALIDHTVPTISIQLLDGNEMTERASLQDFQRFVDVVDVNDQLLERQDVGYAPIGDNIHIGIHVQNTPDLAKYIYYLVIYILNTFKPKLEEQGLMLGTFRATDISKLNEYLPENMYSRFINFSVYTQASFNRGVVPVIESIIGVHASDSEPSLEDGGTNSELGLTFRTIGDTNG